MANSDYTIKPKGHGFCPMGYLSEDIDPLETSLTVAGYTSPIENGIQVGKAALITSSLPSDPDAASVKLLIQGGPDGSLVLQDLSSFGDTADINDYAAFSDDSQVLGANMILTTRLSANIEPFVSTGAASRFGRLPGDKVTIECWVYVEAAENFSISSTFFAWGTSSGSTVQVGTSRHSGDLRLQIRNGADGPAESVLMSAGVLHFIQLNIDDDDTYTLDLDGVEAYSGSNGYNKNFSGDYYFVVASLGPPGSNTAPTTRAYVTPLRFTKGVLRPRGSVPTEPFLASDLTTQEIVAVTAVDGNVLTLGRGCCDTVPAPHSVGDRIWFFDDSIGLDTSEYAGTEVIGVKALPRLSSGATVPIEYVEPQKVEFDLRFARPYPPGLVEVNGEPWVDGGILSSADPSLVISWAHRDRIGQQDQLIDHGQASVGPEPGTTYELTVYKSDGEIAQTVTGLTGTSWTYEFDVAMAQFFSGAVAVGDHLGKITLKSVRDGLDSFQSYEIDFILEVEAGDGGGDPPDDLVLALEVEIPVTAATATIAMNLTQVAVPQSDGSAYVTIFHCPSTLQPDPMPGGVITRMSFGEGLNQSVSTSVELTYTTTGSTAKDDVIDALIEQVNASSTLAALGLTASGNSWLGAPGLQITGPLGLKLHSAYGVMTPGVTAPVFFALNNLLAQEFDLGSPVVPVDLMQIVTATLTGTATIGDRFTIKIGTVSFTYVALSGATLSSIATALAALIDAAAPYVASAVGAVITIESVAPVAFSYAASTEAAIAYAS